MAEKLSVEVVSSDSDPLLQWKAPLHLADYQSGLPHTSNVCKHCCFGACIDQRGQGVGSTECEWEGGRVRDSRYCGCTWHWVGALPEGKAATLVCDGKAATFVCDGKAVTNFSEPCYTECRTTTSTAFRDNIRKMCKASLALTIVTWHYKTLCINTIWEYRQ